MGLVLPNPEPRTPDRESVSGRALELRLHTATPEETEALGRRLGGLLRAGDVIALSGDLGAGKTVLARGIAAGAGAAGHVASPTFTFLREYHGPVTIYHADLYRLDRPQQLEDLGLDEILDGNGIVVLEWAEKARPLLPPEHLWITIRFMNSEDTRQLAFSPKGARYVEIIEKLTKA